ncbi:MAG: hypothetical protein J6T16_00590 [Opitutales bacterium]|nr:hypothetical protein [Opitutales bacterium]
MKIYATVLISAMAAICGANEAGVQAQDNECRSRKPEASQLAEQAAQPEQAAAKTEQPAQAAALPEQNAQAEQAELSPKQALTKLLRELFDAKTDEEQSEIWDKYKKYRKEFPRSITAKDKNTGAVMRLVNEGDTFDCGALEELPTKVVIPKRKTVLSDLPNSYEIRYRFDADKDGELSDSEMFKLLIELHYILQKANSSYEREMLIERYANAITSQENANEFSITWGKNSAFRIAKDKDGRWSAPDEEPVKRHKIGTHPSQTKFRERLGDKKFRAYAMKILSRTNPFLRAEKIEELLNCDAKDYESAAESLAKSPIFSGFYEYINEKSELVLIPLFKTDPAETINALNKFSDENISRFTKDEAREYKNFIQEKTRREEVLF